MPRINPSMTLSMCASVEVASHIGVDASKDHGMYVYPLARQECVRLSAA